MEVENFVKLPFQLYLTGKKLLSALHDQYSMYHSRYVRVGAIMVMQSRVT